MPASRLSLRLTDGYRGRMFAIRGRLQQKAASRWTVLMPGDLDRGAWHEETALAVTRAQTEAVRATAGYLAAFLTAELGRRVRLPQLVAGDYVGLTSDGRPVVESLRSPLIGTKKALKDGSTLEAALDVGLQRARRIVGLDFDHAHRAALLDAIDHDDRFDGWSRAVRGTCGACAARAAGHEHGTHFQVHPGCQCVSEPVARGVPNRFPRPTGTEIFGAKSRQEQDDMLGPEAAERVRAGELALADLVAESRLDSDRPDWITQAPVSAPGT